MKTLTHIFFAAILICMLGATITTAQEPALPSDFVAAGAAFNQYGTPQISGTALYAHQLGAGGTYSFTLIDIFPKSYQPFTVATAVTTGVAQHVRTFGPARVFAVGSIGVATAGEATGWAWTGGTAVAIPLGKGWSLLPNVRVLKSSLTEYQYAVGLMVGWGK